MPQSLSGPVEALRQAWDRQVLENEDPAEQRRLPREPLQVPLGGMLRAPIGPKAVGCCRRVDVLDRSGFGFCLLLAAGEEDLQPGDRGSLELANAGGCLDAPRPVIVRWVEVKPWATAVGVELLEGQAAVAGVTSGADPG